MFDVETGVDLAANVFLRAIFFAGSTLSRRDRSGGAFKACPPNDDVGTDGFAICGAETEEFPPNDMLLVLLCGTVVCLSLDWTRAGDQCTDFEPGVSFTCCGTGLIAKISEHGADVVFKGLFVYVDGTAVFRFPNRRAGVD